MSAGTPGRTAHWDAAYAQGDTGKSWYQEHATTSMGLLSRSAGPADSLIDIGGGASTLVDDLLDRGWTDVSVLDIADTGLRIARQRLGSRAERVTWILADLLAWTPSRTYDVWHDRAVLHFLSGEELRDYREVLLRATRPGSRIIIGVFGPAGPARCSGLAVQRYDAAALGDLLGPQFDLVEESLEVHTTPAAAEQEFQWISAVRRP